MRLGAVKYIIPFFCAYNLALLTHGAWWEVLLFIFFCCRGYLLLRLRFRRLPSGDWPNKLAFPDFPGYRGVLIAFPEIITTLVGIVIVICASLIRYLP